MHRLSSVDLSLVAIYLAGITLFGLQFRSRDRSLKSYFLADRRIPWWAIALSIVAAETSTLTIISVPGLAYTGDWGFLEIVLGYLLGRIVVCIIFLPRYFRGELLTAYEVIGERFGPRLHKLTAFLFLFLRAAAEGVRVFAVSIVVGIAIGTRDIVSIAIICTLTLIYTLEGGMAAVIWTDVVQMALYVAGTIVSVILLGHRVPGGWHAIHIVAAAAGKLTIFHFALSLSQTYTFWAGLAGGCFLTMASHGTDQLMVQRLLAARSLRESRIALLASGVVILVQFALFLAIGTGLYYFYGNVTNGTPPGNPDRVFPAFIVTEMPHGVAGLMVAAILAAAMSNLSAAVNSLSSSSMVDFYMAWKPDADERERARLSRVMTFFWAMLLFVLALMSRGGGHVVEVGLSIASVAYGALLGVFLLGTLTKTATESGAIIGMIGGLVVNILLWKQPHAVPLPKIAWTWFVLIGSLLTFALGWAMSKILPGKRTSKIAVLLIVLMASQLKAQEDPEFRQIDRIVEGGIAAKKFPGAVVIAGHNGKIIFHKAYGNSSLIPAPEPMTEDTIFDLASLTKVLATAPAIMQLYEQGRFQLNDPVAQYLPQFAANGKQDITIRQLLTHYSGLPPDVSLDDPWGGKEEGLRRAFAATPVTAPGVQFRYSDINFIVLGALVEKLSGLTLDQYQQRYLAQPLGVEHMRFLPPESWRSHIAPTQYDHGVMLHGVVHDPTSRRMGGVAGHAGLFSTPGDVAIYAQNLLDRLAGRPSHFPLQQLTLEKMTTPAQPATGTALRGLGWDIDSPFSSNRGELFPVGSFGHTGFTGTSVWMDPTSDTYVVFMSNAVYPKGPTGINAIRGAVATAIARWVKLHPDSGSLAATLTGYNESIAGERRHQDRNGTVTAGIDVLEQEHFAPLAALAAKHGGTLRVGLLTNQTGLDAQGRRTIDVLAGAPGLQVKLLFSPEHGINGALDKEGIQDTKDVSTGLPVVSLYGAQRRPSLETLRGLDAVLIDLQDAGVRFYTYETVVRYFLEAAGRTGIDIVVLDRPDPLGGAFVQGPVSDTGSESYVNVAPIPVRHGMTLGELARYLNGEYKLGAPLTVVEMKGWQRGDWFDATGLTWTNPSPNLRSLREAILYPALGLIETTNISVGRGTDTPFEYVGAPWIDGPALARTLNARFLPGVRFLPVDFTPRPPYPYADQLCHGIELIVTGRNVIDSPELGLEIATAIHKLAGEKFQMNKMETLLANRSVLEALLASRDPQRIAEDWQQQLHDFEAKRKPYLLY
ncbi:MAG: sodium/solute symporter [Acidobacteriaceae bacterium]|jgi:SSS family transporter